MATAQEIETQAALVEVLSRETEGIEGLITAISTIDNWTTICLVRRDLIDSLIERLQAAKDRPNSDPLKEAFLLFNTSEGNIVDIADEQIDGVGDHLKAVFMPAALTAKTSERDAAIDLLKDMRDGVV